MSERTLYYVNGSIPNWRVMFALFYKEIAFTPQRLKVMATRETRSPEFLAINPRGQTPVLVDDDVTINESYAILQYIEARYPAKALLPYGDSRGLARVLARAYEAETFACAYEPLELLFERKPSELESSHKDAVVLALKAVAQEVVWWEARAAEAAYIAGEAFTLADVAFYPTVAYLLRRGLELTSAPNLAAYVRRVEAMPAAVASRPEGWALEGPPKPDLFARGRAIAARHERGE